MIPTPDDYWIPVAGPCLGDDPFLLQAIIQAHRCGSRVKLDADPFGLIILYRSIDRSEKLCYCWDCKAPFHLRLGVPIACPECGRRDKARCIAGAAYHLHGARYQIGPAEG